jgi:PhzF family phenazine biosynthesis protein
VITTRAFKQVDVFTQVPLMGNPVAVILAAEGLSAPQMQAIAHWTNLSETTFVLPPTDPVADYRVRIFTPRSELPFAGHPTLGTAHAVLESGLCVPSKGMLIQECAVGLVEVTVNASGISFRLPRYTFENVDSPEVLQAAIGGSSLLKSSPSIVNVGPRWAIVELVSASAVEELAPDLHALAGYERSHKITGLTIFAEGGAGDITVRSFAPSDGVDEDPVCGSGNAAVAAFRLMRGQVSSGSQYVASQGQQCGRDGQVHVRIEGVDVHVGGHCITCVDGNFKI